MPRGFRAWLRAASWGNGDFNHVWAAHTISQFGTQVSLLALPIAAIRVLHVSAFDVALLGVVQFLPFVFLSLPAGVWIDRMRRKPVLVAADLLRAGLLGSIPLTYAFGELHLWQLYGVGAGVGVCTVFFDIGNQTFLPSLIPAQRLIEANARLEASRSAAMVGGPGLAGILTAALGAPNAILFDGASFVASAFFIARVREPERPTAPITNSDRQQNTLVEALQGLRLIFGHKYWRPIVLTTAALNFFTSIIYSIIIVFFARNLELSNAVIGVVFALGNAGSLIGAVTARRLTTRYAIGRVVVFSALVWVSPLVLVPVAPPDFPVPVIVVGLMTSGFGFVIYNVTTITLQQALIPERLLGRAIAARRFLAWSAIPAGMLTGGAIASAVSLKAAILVGAAGGIAAALMLVVSPVRSARELAADAA